MVAFKIILTVCVCTVAMGGPMGKMGSLGGPFKEIENALTEEQKQQLKAMVHNDTATKQQIKDGMDAFFDQLGGEQSMSLLASQSEFWIHEF